MGDNRAENEDRAVSFDEAVMLLDEIERLRCKLTTYEQRLAELDRLAYCDPLVDLPNRRSFLTALERLIKRVERHDVPAAMLFADVDGLKAINDKFGHSAGDKTLIEVSRLLVAGVRKGDFVGRLSGDEFGILLEHASELSAWQMALRVVETVDDHQFRVAGQQVPLSVAVGVAVIQRADTPESVLARADKEMYRIKRVGPLPAANPQHI